MRDTGITSAQAPVADSTALMRLLDEVPDAGEISIEPCKPHFGAHTRGDSHLPEAAICREIALLSDMSAIC